MMINDTLGHQKGDLVLRTVGERLSGAVRGSDTVGRWQGDEFVVILPGLTAETDAGDVARKLQEAIGKPLRIDELEYIFSASIGISFFPRDGDDDELLLKKADMAMYRAKEYGKNTVRFYASEQEESASRFLEIEQELRCALESGQLELHYQPQVELEYGRIVGFEALIRWRHPVKGLVSPAEFLSIAEDAHLMDDIGAWVIKTACAQNKAWQEAGLRPVRVAVNISSSQFQHRPLSEVIGQALRETRLEAKYLEIEVTEGLVMRDMEETIAELERIRALGVHIAVDDFGTGYSSLSYLKRFPIHTVKIDQSFVRDLHRDPDDAAIVKAIIAMARSLRLHVVAEGVETDSHLAFLVRHGCDTIQGFLFSRAMEPEQAGNLLDENRRLDLSAAKKTAYQRTLLLVDDEANIRSSLTRLLRQEGYRILSAPGGKEGLELLAANEVGVIVSDQRMPEMTGVEFLKQAKTLYPETIRLVLSGYTELNTVTEAINEGAIYKFLTKPWDDELLRANIRKAFELYETVIENKLLHQEIDRINDELKTSNLELEDRVQQKTGEIMRGLNLLHISREILENLPVGIFGVDESGLIVIVNREAERIFHDGSQGPLIGSLAPERLPAAIASRVANGEPTPPGQEVLALDSGRRIGVWYHRMGEDCRSQGIVVVVAKKEQD
jgi:diguanylate cyclase (GGDEF)-like protein